MGQPGEVQAWNCLEKTNVLSSIDPAVKVWSETFIGQAAEEGRSPTETVNMRLKYGKKSLGKKALQWLDLSGLIYSE